MRRDDPRNSMWSDAIAMLARAEELHRQFFRPRPAPLQAAWEPPVDVLELADEVLIVVALPGIDPELVDAAIEGDALLIAGRKLHPPQLRSAIIHRLELPQGRFERRIPLPPGRYSSLQRSALHGCLIFGLRKM